MMEMRYFLNETCVDLGFCGGGRRADIDDMLANIPVDRARFSKIVLEAEGCSDDHFYKPDLEALFSKKCPGGFDPELTEDERATLGLK